MEYEKIKRLLQGQTEASALLGIQMAAAQGWDFDDIWCALFEGLEFRPYDQGTESLIASRNAVSIKMIPFPYEGFEGGAFCYLYIFDLIERFTIYGQTTPAKVLEHVTGQMRDKFRQKLPGSLSIQIPKIKPLQNFQRITRIVENDIIAVEGHWPPRGWNYEHEKPE